MKALACTDVVGTCLLFQTSWIIMSEESVAEKKKKENIFIFCFVIIYLFI